MSSMSLGPRELAREVGVSTDTLRHYERCGLLPGTTRTASGYRRYAPDAADRVRLIQRALVIGFSLKELAQVIAQRDANQPPCRRVRAMVGERLGLLERRIADLLALRDELRALLIEWDERLGGTKPGELAHLLETLAGRPALDRPRSSRGNGRNR